MEIILKEISKVLKDYANKLETDNSNISTEEGLNILSNIAHINLSKQEVADRYNVSTKTIERHEKEGIFPKSHSLKVSKKNWYLDELINFEMDNNININ